MPVSSSNDPRKWSLIDFVEVAQELDESNANLNDKESRFVADMLDARSITRAQKAWLVKLSNRHLRTRYKEFGYS